jgi:hypothetical protein
MAKLKAIETIYNGYRFRSRLEARWAVVFDSLDLKWEYEPQGFELSDGTFYLPDFYLPSISTWCEVKGNMTKEDEYKISLFASDLPENERLWVVRNIPDSSMTAIDDFEMYFSNGGWDCPYILCECPACGKVGIEFDGRGWRVCNHYDINYRNKTFVDVDGRKKKIIYPNCTSFFHEDKGYTGDNQRILNAYNNARQARFEHGEKPNTRNIPKPQAIDIEYYDLPFL